MRVRRRFGGARRGVLAALTLIVFGTTLASCSYGPRYAVTLTDAGHVQVEWCFDTSVTVSVRPDNAVLTATSDGRSNGPFFIDLETAASDQWTPAGTPTFDDDTVIEIRDRPTTAALRVRVGDMEQDRYWYDGEQHSAGEWHEVCDPDGDGLGDLVWFAAAGVLCILTVVGTIVWAIYSAVQERQASRRR